jgi:hypothetical protein
MQAVRGETVFFQKQSVNVKEEFDDLLRNSAEGSIQIMCEQQRECERHGAISYWAAMI